MRGKDKKKRHRRSLEEIDADNLCSADGRREYKKWKTRLDKMSRPVVRFNFRWQHERLEIIEAVADEIDVSTEAFIRSAAYQRAIAELNSKEAKSTEFKRVLSGRYFQRADVVSISWRWRERNVELVDKAAKKMSIDIRTFIDLASYEQAVNIAREANLSDIQYKIAWYIHHTQNDPDFGQWAKNFAEANAEFIEAHTRKRY